MFVDSDSSAAQRLTFVCLNTCFHGTIKTALKEEVIQQKQKHCMRKRVE